MRSTLFLGLGFLVVGLLLATYFLVLPRLPSLLSRRNLVQAVESPYQNLYVTRDGDIVTLRAGSLGARSSAIDVSRPYRHVIEYTEVMMLGLGYVPDPEDVLVLGLGGGTVTKYVHRYYPGARITSVELDGKVVELAREHFDLRPDRRLQIVVEDARRFLARTPERYDLIFVDAYHGDYIPFHLLTREFLTLLRSRLREDGAAVANTWSHQDLYHRESATYQTVFGHFDSYRSRGSSNRIIVAPRHGRKIRFPELRERMMDVQRQRRFREIDLPALLERHYDWDLEWPEGTEILRDDFAPVNFLVEAADR